MQSSEDSRQASEEQFEEQKHRTTNTQAEAIYHEELNLLERERRIQVVVFSSIYEKYIGKKVWITSLYLAQRLTTGILRIENTI